MLGTILAAYKDFEERMAFVEPKLSAFEMVTKASKFKIGRFYETGYTRIASHHQ